MATKMVGDEDSDFGLYIMDDDGGLFTYITHEVYGKVEYRIKFYSQEAAEEMWKEIEFDYYAREVQDDA